VDLANTKQAILDAVNKTAVEAKYCNIPMTIVDNVLAALTPYLRDSANGEATDAKRLDWLAEQLMDIEVGNACATDFATDENTWPDAWRAAIDAAIKAEGTHE